MVRRSHLIAALVFTAGVAVVASQAAGAPSQAEVETVIAGQRPNGDRLMKEAIAGLLEQGVSPETIAKAMVANGVPVETTIGILRALEVPPGVVIKSMHAAVTDPAAKASLNGVLMALGAFGPTMAMIVSPGTVIHPSSLPVEGVIKDLQAIGAEAYMGDVARVLVAAGVTPESLATGLVNQGVSMEAAIAVMRAAAVSPDQISSSLYAAVPAADKPKLDAVVLAAGLPLEAPGAGPAPQSNTNTPTAPSTETATTPVPSVGSSSGGGGSTATTTSPT